MGKNLKIAPFPWDFVTLPEEDRAMATGTCTENLIKIAHVVPEIPADRQTHRQTDTCTDMLTTILATASAGEVSTNE